MADINRALREQASRTSRRSLLARLGTGLIGGSLLTFTSRPKEAKAACNLCGGCGPGVYCASTDLGCCPYCSYCGVGFCEGVSGGVCPTGTAYGWYWYCCIVDQLYICQDCCDTQAPYDCYCTSRGTLGFC